MRSIPAIIFLLVVGVLPANLALAQSTAQQSLASVSAVANYKSVAAGQDGVLAVLVDIKTGYHAQSNTPRDPNLIPLSVTMETSPQAEASAPVYPAGKIETYPALGIMSVYNGKIAVFVPFKVKPDVAPGSTISLKGNIRFQICNDRTCYAPLTRPISIDLPVVTGDAKPESANAEVFQKYSPTTGPATRQASIDEATAPPGGTASNEPTIAPPKQAWDTFTAFGAAIVAGLLFNIMPCVLPVLPLKAIGFYEAAQHQRSRAFLLGLVFSAGIVTVFVLLASLVIVFKAFAWGDLFTKGWFVWGMVGLLVFLSAGLLGGWNLSLPLGIYTFEPRHDTFGGNYFWGVLSAVLATPCTAPLLPAVLLWATQHTAAVGVFAVVLVGVGMSLPYLVLSAMPEVARRFPRTGPWSELFKQMMGFLLLASAAYFGAGRLIAGAQFWWAVTAVIGTGSAFLLLRTIQLSPRPQPVTVSAIIAIVMLGSMFWWTRTVIASEANWEPYSATRFEQLRSSGKPVLIKFTANWCGSCQYVEGTVYHDASVWRALHEQGVAALKVDLTYDDAPGKDLLLQLNPSGGIPLTAIWSGNADTKPQVQLESIYTTNDLMSALKQIRQVTESPTPASAASPRVDSSSALPAAAAL